MQHIKILQKIYDSEIHLSLGWMWDGGVNYTFDCFDYPTTGTSTVRTGERDIDKAVLAIANDAANKYPESEFRKWWEKQQGLSQPGKIEAQFKNISAELIKFLNNHYHPHASIRITTTSAEVKEGIMAYSTDEFVRD